MEFLVRWDYGRLGVWGLWFLEEGFRERSLVEGMVEAIWWVVKGLGWGVR